MNIKFQGKIKTIMRTDYLAIITVFSLILTKCSIPQREIFNKSSEDEIYINIQKKLQAGQWQQAIMQLEYFYNHYPSNPYFQQVQMNLIYAYYKNKDLLLARNVIDRFISLNPTHPNIDYIIYMRGVINMEMDDNLLQRFFGINRLDCDPSNAQDAFNDFSKLVHDYPNSQYVSDAIKRMIFIKNRLASYEYMIAEYYTTRKEWKAVINRVKGMLRDYSDTQATRNSLKLMENAYRKMKMTLQAEKIATIIAANSGE